MGCPVCGDEGVAERDCTDDVTGERFEIRRSGCGLAFTTPLPADLSPYYAKGYYADQRVAASFTERLRWTFVIRVAHRIRGTGRILDVGCGAGRLAAALQRRGWEVTGVDPSEAAVSAVLSQGMHGFLGGIEDVPESEFDAIVFNHSLEHVPDPLGALETAFDKLRPGGTLHLAVPNYGGWLSRFLGERWLQLDVPRHVQHFDRKSLTSLVEQSRFEDIQIRAISMAAGPAKALGLKGRPGRLISYGLYVPLSLADLWGEGDCLNLRTKRPDR